jgi:hypothetical protein
MIAGFCSLAIWKSCLTNLDISIVCVALCKGTYRSDSPIHLETKSLLDTLKKVLFASVATAFAKKLFPVPGGPYSKIPLHGVLLPVNNCGNLMGKMTASLSASFACANPATSSQATLGDSDKIAPCSPDRSFLISGSSSSPPPPPPLTSGPPADEPDAPAAAPTLDRVRFSSVLAICSLSFSARSRYSVNFFRMSSLSLSFFSSECQCCTRGLCDGVVRVIGLDRVGDTYISSPNHQHRVIRDRGPSKLTIMK